MAIRRWRMWISGLRTAIRTLVCPSNMSSNARTGSGTSSRASRWVGIILLRRNLPQPASRGQSPAANQAQYTKPVRMPVTGEALIGVSFSAYVDSQYFTAVPFLPKCHVTD